RTALGSTRGRARPGLRSRGGPSADDGGPVSDDPPAARPADGQDTPAGAMDDRPAAFRDVFAVQEFRAIYLACALSWVGDYLARILGGPLLAALAERYPYRRVMIICDLARMVLIGVVAIPGLPVAATLVVLFLAMLANPPTQAARSALLPLILSRDRLVVGL